MLYVQIVSNPHLTNLPSTSRVDSDESKITLSDAVNHLQVH